MELFLAFKNCISRKSSLVIILFIAFAVSLLVVTNAVFDSTEHGVQETFVASCTGDFAVFPVAQTPLSVFGDETPVTGALTEVPRVVPFEDIMAAVSAVPGVRVCVPQVSGRALMEKDGVRTPVALFGVTASDYVKAMSAITITAGAPYGAGVKGVMLPEHYARQLNAAVGDTVQFTVSDGITFRIRAAPVTAIYTYAVQNQTLDRIVIIDPATLRSIMNMTGTVSESAPVAEEKKDLIDESQDIGALFDDAGDTGAVTEAAPEPAAAPVASAAPQSTSWNFVIGSIADHRAAGRTIRALNRMFRKNGWPVRAVNWRTAAGSTALYLYWMRLILNAGILIVLAAGFIVVNNTLVINVLDRTQEIGTLRAVGATRAFVSRECMAETLLLALTAGVAGCALGSLAAYLVTRAHIVFTNAFLIQLFGGGALVTAVTLRNLAEAFALSAVLGLVGWVRPVQAALAVSPVRAMQGE